MKKYIYLVLIFIFIFTINSTVLADAYSDQIDAYKKAWDKANKAGDAAGKKAANDAANKLRVENGQTPSKDGSADKRYNETKVEQLKETNPTAHKELSERLAKGEPVYIHVRDDGYEEYSVPPRTTSTTSTKTIDQMSPKERESYVNSVPKSNAGGSSVNFYKNSFLF